VSQSARRDPKQTLHSSKPAHTGLFAIRSSGNDRYNAVDPALIAYSSFTVRRNQTWPPGAVNFDTRHRCDLVAPDGVTIGYLAEHCGGDVSLLGRVIRGSRRSLTATIWDSEFKPQIQIRRPFYLLLSDTFFATAEGGRLGSVHRTFSLAAVRYVVKDTKGRHFATMTRSFFSLAYTVTDVRGTVIGTICRNPDDRSFAVTTENSEMSDLQRTVLTAAAVALDPGCLDKETPK
jgi:hypothetical protein